MERNTDNEESRQFWARLQATHDAVDKPTATDYMAKFISTAVMSFRDHDGSHVHVGSLFARVTGAKCTTTLSFRGQKYLGSGVWYVVSNIDVDLVGPPKDYTVGTVLAIDMSNAGLRGGATCVFKPDLTEYEIALADYIVNVGDLQCHRRYAEPLPERATVRPWSATSRLQPEPGLCVVTHGLPT